MRVALAAPTIAAASKRARWSKSPPDEHAFSSDGRALRGYHFLAQAALILITLARFTRALRPVYRRLGEPRGHRLCQQPLLRRCLARFRAHVYAACQSHLAANRVTRRERPQPAPWAASPRPGKQAPSDRSAGPAAFRHPLHGLHQRCIPRL